jgi:hypothetical protein
MTSANSATADHDGPHAGAGAGLSGVVATGRCHTCALLGNGTLQCWGQNQFDNSATDDDEPDDAVPVSGITSAVGVTYWWHQLRAAHGGSVR